MKLNALDIRKQEFSTRFRGYDPDEVESFVQMMAQQWQEMTDDMRRLEQRIDEQATKLGHYMKVEEALEQALETAREGARQRLETADQRASATVDDAERRARALIEDAEYRSRSLLDESEKRARTIVGEAERRAGALLAEAEDRHIRARQAVSDASRRRGEIVARLRAFLATEMELLSGFEGDQDIDWTATEAASGRTAIAEQDYFDQGADNGTKLAGYEDPFVAPIVPESAARELPVPTGSVSMPSVVEETVPEPLQLDEEPAPEFAESPEEIAEPDQSTFSFSAESIPEEEPFPPSPVDGTVRPDSGKEGMADRMADVSPIPEPEADTVRGSMVSTPDPVVETSPLPEEPTAAVEPPPVEEPRVRRIKPKTPAAKQADLLDDAGEYGGASDEIKKIRRILEDLDR